MGKHARFLNFFPTPSFLMMPATSISVSDETLKLVELKKRKNSIELKTYREEKLKPGTVVESEVINFENLLSSLNELKSSFKTDYVALSLPEEKGYIYTVFISSDEEKITEEQVAFTLEKNVPFSINEVVFDYVETGEKNKEGREVVVMVLPSNVVQGYIDVFKKVKLTPLYFEIESFSLSRAVVNKKDPRTHLLVHIQNDMTNISIISRNIPRFTSTVRNSLVLERINNSHEAATWLKEEVSKVKSYWLSHGSKNTGNPQTVILCGEKVGKGIEKDVLSSGLDVEVNIANVWENITNFDDYVPDMPHSESLRYGASVGLALREFKRIH
jgi:type IV pilus assembly protein PilM